MLEEALFILLLILANAFFAGSEIAVIGLRKTRVEQLLELGRPGARALKRVSQQPERFLATVQVGISVVGATAAAVGGQSVAHQLEPLFKGVAPNHADEIALGVVIAAISFLSIVLGELVPKSLALRNAEGYALLVSKPILFLSWLARPLVWLLTATSNLLLRPLGDRTNFTESRHSPEEIQALLEEASAVGTVDSDVGEMAVRAMEMSDLKVGQVMVARTNVVALPASATVQHLSEALSRAPHSRLPVWEGQPCNIIGYIRTRDLLSQFLAREEVSLRPLIRPPFFVPETASATDLMTEMRLQRAHLGIVVDESGAMVGIVTYEDLTAEVMGRVPGEHLQAEPSSSWGADGTAVVSGQLRIRDVNRSLDLTLPEGPGMNTLAGLWQWQAGRIGRPGDVIVLAPGVSAEVLEATSQRIALLRLRTTQRLPDKLQRGEQ